MVQIHVEGIPDGHRPLQGFLCAGVFVSHRPRGSEGGITHILFSQRPGNRHQAGQGEEEKKECKGFPSRPVEPPPSCPPAGRLL